MQRFIKDFLLQQGRCERIKDFPYPRQYATINAFFIKLFCLLLPFGLLREFDKLNDSVEGVIKGHMVWLVIPFSVLISWMYTSLDRVGESTENPFQGSANDVPISQMCRTAEIDFGTCLAKPTCRRHWNQETISSCRTAPDMVWRPHHLSLFSGGHLRRAM